VTQYGVLVGLNVVLRVERGSGWAEMGCWGSKRCLGESKWGLGGSKRGAGGRKEVRVG